MNVASLELCKELYELSGWEDTLVHYITSDESMHFDEKIGVNTVEEKIVGLRPNNTVGCDECEGAYAAETIPAYDLGYLLRKLQPLSKIQNLSESYIVLDHADYLGWRARLESKYDSHRDKWIEQHADTPEDAACKLAIELFKSGVLKRA